MCAGVVIRTGSPAMFTSLLGVGLDHHGVTLQNKDEVSSLSDKYNVDFYL